MPLSPNPSQGLGITLPNCAHPPSPLRISTTSSPPLEPGGQTRAHADGQGSPIKVAATATAASSGGIAGTRLRVKTNDSFALRPTHSHSPTASISSIPSSPLTYSTGTVKSLRTSKPLGPRSSPREGGTHGLRVEVEEMYRDEAHGEENGGDKDDDRQRLVPSPTADTDADAHAAPSRAPSSASVISTSFSASTHHTSSSKVGRVKSSEVLRRRGAAKEGGKYMQLEGGDGEREDEEIVRSPLSGKDGYREQR